MASRQNPVLTIPGRLFISISQRSHVKGKAARDRGTGRMLQRVGGGLEQRGLWNRPVNCYSLSQNRWHFLWYFQAGSRSHVTDEHAGVTSCHQHLEQVMSVAPSQPPKLSALPLWLVSQASKVVRSFDSGKFHFQPCLWL